MSQDRPNQTQSPRLRVAMQGALLLLSFVAPVLIAHLMAPAPQTRRIHIEHFRYGMDPEVIHVNRGDRLILTFSARDTAHSFFMQEHDIDAKISPHTGEVEVTRPSDPEGRPELMREVVIEVGRPGILGLFNTKLRYRCHVYCGEMHAFEQGVVIVHPNFLHIGALGVLFALPLAGLLGWRRREPDEPPSPGRDLLRRWPWLKRAVKSPTLQSWIIIALAGFLYLVVLICLLGTTMAGGNLGVLLVWLVWLTALVVVLVPLGGRVWCAVCPLPMFGDLAQRGSIPRVLDDPPGPYNNRFRGLMRAWPRRLANPIPRTVVFMGFGTVSTLLVSQPRWTGWGIIILMVLGTAMPLVFELRAFCRYMCPINTFIGLYATMSRLTLRARKAVVCDRCKGRDIETCRTGNVDGWACPYGLSTSTLHDNMECGLCMECIRSCAHDNVTLHWRPFGLQAVLAKPGDAWQAIVMLCLGIAYNITFHGPWHAIRDMVNIVDKDNGHLFVVYTAALWTVGMGLVPAAVALLSRLGTVLSGTQRSPGEMFRRDASALVPLGLFIWIAFSIPMLMIDGTFVLSAASDPFGWGWDLFGTAGEPWWQLWPEAIAWIQCVVLLVGLGLGLSTGRRMWSQVAPTMAQTLRGMAPGAALQIAIAFGLLWLFAA